MARTSSKNESIEIITSMQRRRRWSPSEKQCMVQETYEPGATVSYVARKHGIMLRYLARGSVEIRPKSGCWAQKPSQPCLMAA